MKRARLLLAAPVATLLIVSCSSLEADEPVEYSPASGEESGAQQQPAEEELEGDLPPVDPLALTPLYGAALAEHGVELTERGGLIDREDGYEVSADGTHLALYVAPIAERTDDEYVEGIVELARVFLNDVFERWPGLESFDVCQERPGEEVESGYVATVSQIDVYRDPASNLEWEALDLADLFAADDELEGFSLRVFGHLHDHEAVAEARSDSRSDDDRSW